MRYFLSKHIHSGFSSYQFGDVFMHREIIKSSKTPDKWQGPEYTEKVVDRKLGFTIYHVEADETFYQRGLKSRNFLEGYSNTPEFKALVKSYEDQGWKQKLPWLDKAQEAHWEAEKIATHECRVKQGYVIPTWHKDIPVADYQGGFSDNVFNQKQLQDYLKNGGCHGYIGHSVRKKNIDRYIETKFIATARPICILEHLEPEKLLAVWLTSSDGRHFGDSLEFSSFKKQKEKVDNTVRDMYNRAFIYSLPEHKGSADSTAELMEKYKSKLLP